MVMAEHFQQQRVSLQIVDEVRAHRDTELR